MNWPPGRYGSAAWAYNDSFYCYGGLFDSFASGTTPNSPPTYPQPRSHRSLGLLQQHMDLALWRATQRYHNNQLGPYLRPLWSRRYSELPWDPGISQIMERPCTEKTMVTRR